MCDVCCSQRSSLRAAGAHPDLAAEARGLRTMMCGPGGVCVCTSVPLSGPGPGQSQAERGPSPAGAHLSGPGAPGRRRRRSRFPPKPRLRAAGRGAGRPRAQAPLAPAPGQTPGPPRKGHEARGEPRDPAGGKERIGNREKEKGEKKNTKPCEKKQMLKRDKMTLSEIKRNIPRIVTMFN